MDDLSGAEILHEAYGLVTGPRQNTYAHPAKDYQQAVDIFKALTGIELTVTEALLFMVSVKLSRLRTNLGRKVLHYDSLLDTLGYLACINMAEGATNGQVHERGEVLPADVPRGETGGDQVQAVQG